jgi:XTP/dITP diphosphohydrolase
VIVKQTPQKIVVATRNAGKFSEIRAILRELSCEVLPVTDIVPDFFVEEDGKTYTDNAIKKAQAAAQLTGILAIADDSGLEVDALDGAPGVHSARFGGESLPQAEKNRLLLSQLDGISARSARFRCVIAVATPNGDIRTTEGVCEGPIGYEPQGTQGFGYDPIFVLPEYKKTMAELDPALKNSISHRARALSGLRDVLTAMQQEGILSAF